MIDVYPAKVAVSVVIYCLSVSAVPIYNKEVFSGGVGSHSVGLRKFPYPIATAFLQLSLCSVVLGLANVLGHVFALRKSDQGASWLFGPHLGYKLRHVAPVGLLFGFKYGLTNWGLQLLPTGQHLLLQSTDLIWTVVTARMWNKEKLGVVETVAAMLATVGSVMIGIHAGQVLVAPALPLLVNCLTPLVLALCISTLRSGVEELYREDNPVHGSVSPAEFTSLKLFLSALMALLLSLILESGTIAWTQHEAERRPWWVAVQHEQVAGIGFLLLGGVFVLIFQVNITWLSGLTSAVTVGVVGGVKVVPQWLLSTAFQGPHVDVSPLNMAGAALILSASILYACSISKPYTLTLGWSGFEWRLREDTLGSFCEVLMEEDDSPECKHGASKKSIPHDVISGKLQRSASAERLLTPSAVLEVSVSSASVALPNRESGLCPRCRSCPA